MVKVVYNACFGGFGLSQAAIEMLRSKYQIEGETEYEIMDKLPRHDLRLVDVVEALGERASGGFAKLRIHVAPGNRYRIDEYDGYERVETPEESAWTEVSP